MWKLRRIDPYGVPAVGLECSTRADYSPVADQDGSIPCNGIFRGSVLGALATLRKLSVTRLFLRARHIFVTLRT
jgi:hypothetical protein